jgi:hypothetical protein
MLKSFFVLICSFFSFFSFSQSNKFTTKKIFLNPIDTVNNCYTIVYPKSIPYKSFLILIPGFGQSPSDVFIQTDLPSKFAENGILTIIPSLNEGALSFGVDSSSQKSLSLIYKDVTSKIKLLDAKFYIGGFSLGGSCAIKFAEESEIKPNAVFAIDPPLDFERVFNSAERNIRQAEDGNINQESAFLVSKLIQLNGGSPKERKTVYYQMSPYSFTDSTQNAVKRLVNTPIKIFCEPDINWWINERGSDLYTMNVLDCSAFINELSKLGNQNAFLELSQNKGFRKPTNSKHPHSWSIVNSDDLIHWLLIQK